MNWKQIGKKRKWEQTIAGAVLDEKLYTVETNGALYVTDLKSGEWRQIGKPEFSNTLFMFATKEFLVTIEKDGTLYVIEVN